MAKQYKVRMTKHTKFEDIITGAKTEKEAFKEAEGSIRIVNPIESESVTIEIVTAGEPTDKKELEGLNIPPDRRTEDGQCKEGLLCMACRRLYTNEDDMESITHTNECMTCQKIRGDIADQHQNDIT